MRRTMKELLWQFPTHLDEAVRLLQEPGAALHAGGTSILRVGTGNLAALIDLHGLGLRHFRVSDGRVELGAMLTFADVLEKMRAVDPRSILVQALSGAASTPLRNRITVGGSVAMAPLWSDLMGPLLALGADVVLLGDDEIVCPFAQLLEDRAIRAGKLVTAIRFDQGQWQSSYYRATTTHFDYAAFTISTLVRRNSREEIEDARLVVTGSRQRYKRLTAQEQALIGRKRGDLDSLPQIAAAADVEFARKNIGSPEYVRHLFGVELERALERAVRGQ
jgi:CO/xanthine dehydrogenase FAD-binding subunit